MARPATADDARDAIQVVRDAITACAADHRNDPATLERWLANKQPKNFERWIANPDNFCVVEEVDGKLRGVGVLRRDGELLLFYVAPGHWRRGLGRDIHAALETRAIEWGLPKLHLESTFAARRFYESMGYRPDGHARPLFGVLSVYPYAKRLRLLSAASKKPD
ncbi:MAG: GNAT family N-acetyltransferase [Xanthomonadaceae bacterium]|nr:GNAT family N-acetyltransferase [Xanthomonadaceae bacterium]